MGSPATPPWMSELVARNHKIVRNMWHSSESYFDGDDDTNADGDHSNNNESVSNSKTGGNHKKQVVEPSMNVTHPSHHKARGRTTMADVVQEQMHRTKASKRKTNTGEKSSPIREENGYMDDVNPKSKHYNMRHNNGGGEEQESILEYGPGIVRKLRSRYQSLALRQYSTRPSLRRSASLENVIDMDIDASGVGIIIKPESPSPTPFDQQNYINTRTSDNRIEDKNNEVTTSERRMTKSKSATAVLEQNSQTQSHHHTNNNQQQQQMYEKKLPGLRGRAAVSERRDRMRRARSVDALQRTKHEEEILEKFKSVVLPKEEIVIIEVSKPRANLNGLGGLSNNSYYLPTGGGDKTYPPQLFISPGLTVSEQGSGGNRARSFISPEHELPPHDIVRETARIFEKNQENNKRVGHALRLSKSQQSSIDNCSTPPLSPIPLSPSTVSSSTTTINNNTMAQSVNLSSDNSNKNIPSSTTFNNITNAKPTSLSHGFKQVGIIRPTVSHPTTKSCIISSPPNILSPILSPSQTPYKQFLQQHSSKPPLSPKPLFTSSPKLPQSPVVKSPVDSSPVVSHQSKNEIVATSSVPEVNKKASTSPVNKGHVNVNEDRDHLIMRQPLKHVPNSFTINSNNTEIVPASVPLVTQNKSSPNLALNGVHNKNKVVKTTPSLSNTSQDDIPKNNAKTVTTRKIIEPDPPNTNNNIFVNHHERQKSPPSQQQRPTAPPPPPRKVEDNASSSQLRAHQQQKSNQGGNSPMVFNFVNNQKSVPNYIEDDGLHHKGRLTLAGTVSDESVDDIDSSSDYNIDAKLIKIIGGSVIINGKSSIQKKPKSTKMNISFNEDAITTYEYPSESSLLIEEDINEKDMLGHKKGPSVVNNSGTGLSSYTSKFANNDYQLGSFETTSSPKKPEVAKKEKESDLIIEDYLKPNADDTTWSNEQNADILF